MSEAQREFIRWLCEATEAKEVRWRHVPDLLGGTLRPALLRGPVQKRLYSTDVTIDKKSYAVLVRGELPTLQALPAVYRLTVTEVATGADYATASSTDPGLAEDFERLWKAIEAQASSPFEALVEGLRKAG